MIHQHNHPLMALITVERPTFPSHDISLQSSNEQNSISNEIYIAVRGADIIFPYNECCRRSCARIQNFIPNQTNDVREHLSSILKLLRPEDKLRMAVRLESQFGFNRIRYLLVVTNGSDESCFLGIDYNVEIATIGLVLPIWNDIKIALDGDGGFRITSGTRHHIFKPVSVQAMWSAFQALHLASHKSIQRNFYEGGGSHSWTEYYQKRISSNQSFLHEWFTVITDDDDLNTRKTFLDHLNNSSDFEELISARLKSIMMSLDLEQVTSKEIRSKLESHFHHDLRDYKSYIDREMIRIMGQMEQASKILDYLYLGSEWNASNFEELKGKGVQKILNVTCEIDNFFPGCFEYLNIRIHDDELANILRHLNDTFYYIQKAKDEGQKVLVHCKKGISRSASVVVAYIMKEKNCDLEEALEYVRKNRSTIRPNPEFLKQLEIYQGMLHAKNEVVWRSNSDSDLNNILSSSSSSSTTNNNNNNNNNNNTANTSSTNVINRKKIRYRSSIRFNDKENNLSLRFGCHQRRGSWPPKNVTNDEKQRLQQHLKSNKVKERIENFERYKHDGFKPNKMDLFESIRNDGVVSKLTDHYESNNIDGISTITHCNDKRVWSYDNIYEITKQDMNEQSNKNHSSNIELNHNIISSSTTTTTTQPTKNITNLDLFYLRNNVKSIKRRTEELNLQDKNLINNSQYQQTTTTTTTISSSPQTITTIPSTTTTTSSNNVSRNNNNVIKPKKTYGATHPLDILKNNGKHKTRCD